jgi:hypothetical protein
LPALPTHIQRNDIVRAIVSDNQPFVERDLDRLTAAFLWQSGSRVIDEDPSHDAGRHTQEMSAALAGNVSVVDQAHIRLVDERRRLEAVAGAFAGRAAPSDVVQFTVYDRYQSLEGRLVSMCPFEEQRCDVGGILQSAPFYALCAALRSSLAAPQARSAWSRPIEAGLRPAQFAAFEGRCESFPSSSSAGRRSRHLPTPVVDGGLTENRNKTVVRLWTWSSRLRYGQAASVNRPRQRGPQPQAASRKPEAGSRKPKAESRRVWRPS